MLIIEDYEDVQPKQMIFAIEGMRNPMNSWHISDSELEYSRCELINYKIGARDKNLMQVLAKTGPDHRKFMRMMPVCVRITAPLYWWKEFDTYKVGTVANSCSTMHKILEKAFVLDDFSTDHLLPESIDAMQETIKCLNDARHLYLNYEDAKKYYGNKNLLIPSKKQLWWQLIQLLPSSYNQTRNVMLNYEVLYNMYHARKNHKLDEWEIFCKWIKTLQFSYLITGEDILKEGLQEGLQPGA